MAIDATIFGRLQTMRETKDARLHCVHPIYGLQVECHVNTNLGYTVGLRLGLNFSLDI